VGTFSNNQKADRKMIVVPKEHITEYIPQRNPIVMIDTLNYCEGDVTKTSFEIRNDNIFVKDGILHEPGIIENIAQTAAMKAGYEVKKNGAQPLIGFIGAIKDLVIYKLPEVGDVLETTVTIKMEVMGITLVEGFSVCNGNKIASCEMKIFIQNPELINE
jgi:predicted hotdog family 3-hydroxylacyl-ACP dehydratase